MVNARGSWCWAAAGLIVLSGQANEPEPASPGALEGSRLVLRGAGGLPYLTIEQAQGGDAALSLLDRAGTARVELSLPDDR